MQKREEVNIVVVGDDKAGKSTLINTFVKEEFEEDLPQVLPVYMIPADITIDHLNTLITDTNLSQMVHLKESLYTADVVCLVYDACQASIMPSGPQSDNIAGSKVIDRIATFWMPLIRSNTKQQVPVILVANKIDLQPRRHSNAYNGTSSPTNIHAMSLMQKFKEIESCCEVSCKEMVNVAEVFYFCGKAVLHPTSPLWDVHSHSMKREAKEALERIFKLCDLDNDNLLDDSELNRFQRKVFGSPLQSSELEGVKDVVRQGLPAQAGVRNNALTVEGFVYLHSLFIQRGRRETIWKVLRKFGYDNQVELRFDFISPELKVGDGDATELSPRGYQFFIDLFRRFDLDHNGSLSDQEINALFSTCPVFNGTRIPWSNYSERTVSNGPELTLQGFLALWSMTTLLDYNKTLAYLAYLGFEGDSRSAVKVIKNRRDGTIRKRNARNVFHCLLLGAKGCGKTEFCRFMAEKQFHPQYDPNYPSMTYVNAIDSQGSEKYLIIQEVAIDEVTRVTGDKQLMEDVDAVIMMYDCSDANSFNYITSLRQQSHDLDFLPLVIVGSRRDSPMVKQLDCPLQPADYCQSLKIPPPCMVSCKTKDVGEVFTHVVQVCLAPYQAIPHSSTSITRILSSNKRLTRWLGVSSFAAVLCASGFWMLRRYPTSIRRLWTRITSVFYPGSYQSIS
ncbi:hypothetical protein MIR68_003395 [Amoeboaphelidium protococcarum]|nr:hypothetical protein MIR68_003395 [Amoeboaphelidium protococcarum]